MEEYVPGVVTTYDGICNSKGEVLFAASHITRNSIMDMVNEGVPTYYYVDRRFPPMWKRRARRCCGPLAPPAGFSTWSFSA